MPTAPASRAMSSKAIQFAVDNRERLKIDIINLSLGHPIYEPSDTDPLVQAVEGAVRAGIVVVASAGKLRAEPRDGRRRLRRHHLSGNAPSAITVGALDTQGTVSRLRRSGGAVQFPRADVVRRALEARPRRARSPAGCRGGPAKRPLLAMAESSSLRRRQEQGARTWR